MRSKVLSLLFAGVVGWLSVAQARAGSPTPEGVVADVVVVRPACFVATVVGSAVFVVALPIAALSKSVRKTADTLVVKPAQATFTRPLGEFESLE